MYDVLIYIKVCNVYIKNRNKPILDYFFNIFIV